LEQWNVKEWQMELPFKKTPNTFVAVLI
jgi:hypothetical protein